MILLTIKKNIMTGCQTSKRHFISRSSTGKTLLVKTMAEDLDIPIESMCGSEFVKCM